MGNVVTPPVCSEVAWYFLKFSCFFRAFPLTRTEAWLQTKRWSIIYAVSHRAWSKTIRDLPRFVPGHTRLHTQGRVNGYIPHIRALAEGGRARQPGAEAKDFCKGACFTESTPELFLGCNTLVPLLCKLIFPLQGNTSWNTSLQKQ